MPEFRSGELLLHFDVKGDGPQAIVHPGGPGMDSRYMKDLGGIDASLSLGLLHPRGTGFSGSPSSKSEYSLADYSADIESFRTHLGAERPFLIGHSHGGMAVMRYAIDHPEEVGALILIDTAANLAEFLSDIEGSVEGKKDEPWFEEANAALQKEWAGEFETAEELGALVWKELAFYFKDYGETEKEYVQSISHLPVNPDPLRCFNEHEAESMDLRTELKQLDVPCLVIVGRHDFITNTDMGKDIATNIGGSRLEIFENSGHFPYIEEPELFRQVISDFIASV